MKNTGIIMSGDHPVKVLNGSKTMTRRTWGLEKINRMPDIWHDPFFDDETGYWNFWQVWTGDVLSAKCPYGGVGDLLWMKETLYRNPYLDEAGYLVDKSPVFINQTIGNMLKWRWQRDILSAMFMPRCASRADMEITGLRPERLQIITEEDAIAEGYENIDEYIISFIQLYHLSEGADLWNWVLSYKLIESRQ